MRFSLFLSFLFISLIGFSQSDLPEVESPKFDTLTNHIYVGNTDQKAKQAVGKIMQYTGLPQNFIVVSENVRTAVAYMKNKERYIAYNESFINRISDSTSTDWSAISILAHEIAHHLAGHIVNLKNSSPGDELEADLFSGFILYRMGATLNESLAAMREFEPDTTNKRYPLKKLVYLPLNQDGLKQKC
ncbi:MAG: M48 family metalloprotease [Flavobacteriales bacterium]|nr:M48 family metalloprotease [Flavobacteriales bacterium]